MRDITFKDMDLSEEVVKALDKMGAITPTTVQREAIPLLMKDECLIAKAPTGTGKTFAFSIPILEYLDMSSREIQALVLCPTRELALQIASEMKGLGRYIKGFNVCAIIGGQSMKLQAERIAKHPQVVVATPGRLLDLYERKLIDIRHIYTLVLDEADEMLRMGFIKSVQDIIKITPRDKQMALFSATMPREVLNITWSFMQGAKEIDVMPKAEDRPQIDEYMLEVAQKDKALAIIRIIKSRGFTKSIVFCNTKNATTGVQETLQSAGFKVGCLQGNMGQGARNRVMDAFRAAKYDILVATDVVARGIDVDDVDAVFNYDIPKDNEFYLHRIGRTARAGKKGQAFSLVSYLDKPRMEEIIRYTGANPTLIEE